MGGQRERDGVGDDFGAVASVQGWVGAGLGEAPSSHVHVRQHHVLPVDRGDGLAQRASGEGVAAVDGPRLADEVVHGAGRVPHGHGLAAVPGEEVHRHRAVHAAEGAHLSRAVAVDRASVRMGGRFAGVHGHHAIDHAGAAEAADDDEVAWLVRPSHQPREGEAAEAGGSESEEGAAAQHAAARIAGFRRVSGASLSAADVDWGRISTTTPPSRSQP